MLTEQIRICKYSMHLQNMFGETEGKSLQEKKKVLTMQCDMLCLLGYTI